MLHQFDEMLQVEMLLTIFFLFTLFRTGQKETRVWFQEERKRNLRMGIDFGWEIEDR
jgi:hypothetical protein